MPRRDHGDSRTDSVSKRGPAMVAIVRRIVRLLLGLTAWTYRAVRLVVSLTVWTYRAAYRSLPPTWAPAIRVTVVTAGTLVLFGLAAATGSSPAKTPTAQASSAPIADPTVTQRPLQSPPPTLAMQAAPSPALSSAAPLTATTAARASTPTSAPSAVVATRANTRPQVQATDAARTPCEDFAIFYSDLVTYTPHDLLRLIPDVQQVQKDALRTPDGRRGRRLVADADALAGYVGSAGFVENGNLLGQPVQAMQDDCP